MDIIKLKTDYNLTNDEIDEIIFLESLENKNEHVKCCKCGKRILKLVANKYNDCCLSCFDFWYC